MNYGISENPLDSPDVIFMILSKVPGHLQGRWNRNALRIRRTETREPGLLDLTNLIEDEMILVNDPLFSRQVVGQYDEKPPRPQKFQKYQKIRTYAITKDAVYERELTQNKTGNCPVCEKGHHCSRQKQNNLQEETLLCVSGSNFKGSQCQKVL